MIWLGNVYERTAIANSLHYRVFCGGGIGSNKVTDEWNNGGGVVPTATGNRVQSDVVY